MSFSRLCFWLALWWTGVALSQAGTLAQFRTPFGDIEVELYDKEKPVTVQNFLRYVQTGAYQNTFFHRLQPGFVAQGGGFFTTTRLSTNLFAPPWANLGAVPSFGNITNEFGVGPLLSNTNGTLAMAKSGGDPNSASCQWFFNLSDNSANLDNQNGGFTVFGRVVQDSGGVLALFNSFYAGYGLVSLPWWYPNDVLATNLFQTLPVTYGVIPPATPPPPRYEDLVYVDLSLLSVQVTLAGGQRQISWNSVNAKTNFVDFTTNLPPAWSTLLATNGNGSRFAILDPAPTNRFRFYRVRIAY